MHTPTNTPKLPSSRQRAAWSVAVLCALLSACAVPVTRTVRVYDEPGAYHRYPPPPIYARYGTVQRVEVVDTRIGETGAGAAVGAVLGGVLGNQFGHGAGRAATTALGVFGGAVAGNQVERNEAAAASGRTYHVHVRFDDGGHQVFDYAEVNGLHAGERVKVESGVLLPG